MFSGIIYRATSPSNKRYYGRTTRCLKKRIWEHYNRKRNWAFPNALRKYGPDNFKWEVIETYSFETINELNEKLAEREKYWIDLDKTNVHEFGYNMTIGGDGTSGHKYTFTPEHIENLRKSHQGKIQSKEEKDKKSKTLLGRKKSKEHCKHISEGRTGITFSPEHCENIRKSKLGKKRKCD